MADSTGTPPEPHDDKRPIIDFLRNPLTALAATVLAVVIGWYCSYYYYEKGLSDEVAEAREQGQQEGIAKGMDQAKAAEEQRLPKLVEARYQKELQARADASYAQGQKAGWADGSADGFARGVKSGRQSVAQEAAAAEAAARAWDLFEAAVRKAGSRAEALDKEGSGANSPAAKALIRDFNVVEDYAKRLNGSYQNKANSFDSIVEDIANAIKTEKYTIAISLIIKLRDTLRYRSDQFHQADTQITQAVQDFAAKSRQ